MAQFTTPNVKNSLELNRLLEEGARNHVGGRHALAEKAYLAAVQLDPSRTDAKRLLGLLYVDMGAQTKARTLLKDLLSRDIKESRVLHELALAFERLSLFAEAREALVRAISLDPRFLDARLSLGWMMTRYGETAEALHTFRRCVDLFPEDPRPLAEMARLLVFEGRFDEARHFAERAFSASPTTVSALAFQARTRKFTATDPLIARLREAIGTPGLSTLDQQLLHQALGKVLDDAGFYDEAFVEFKKGNALSAKAYDHGAQCRAWNDLTAQLTPAFFDTRKDFGDPSRRPIFVVGMPRSGTSLIEQVLSSHPMVFGAGEIYALGEVASRAAHFSPSDAKYPSCLEALTSEGVRLMARQYLGAIARHNREAARVTDKYPPNFEHIGLIALLFPNAKIVYCKRDPRDVGISVFLNLLSSPYPWSGTLQNIADHYRAHTKLMRHWMEVLPGRIHTVVYEDFVADFEPEARKLVAACDLPWDDACLRYDETDRSVRTPSAWQVRQPVYQGSVGRWRRYEKHLGPLLELAETP